MRQWHPRVFGTNKDVILVTLGELKKLLNLLPSFERGICRRNYWDQDDALEL